MYMIQDSGMIGSEPCGERRLQQINAASDKKKMARYSRKSRGTVAKYHAVQVQRHINRFDTPKSWQRVRNDLMFEEQCYTVSSVYENALKSQIFECFKQNYIFWSILYC